MKTMWLQGTKVGAFAGLLGLCAGGWCTSGCGSAASTPAGGADAATAGPRVFVGAVNASDARVAVVARGAAARLYFCGGDASYQSFTRWLDVTADGTGRVQVEPDAGAGFRVAAKLSSSALRGTVDDGDGESHDFVAQLIAPHTIAGLYEASPDCGRVGLIVTQASAQAEPVGQGACIPDDGSPVQQVNPLLPLSRAKDGTIAVQLAGASDEIAVKAAKPPG